jgi:3-isopropylmalate dehydrogenase
MTVVLAPGDGIGVEVIAEARKVLTAIAPDVAVAEYPIGASAIASHGDPLPPETLAACLQSDGVLMGACGTSDHSWSGRTPEDGMFALRRKMDVYANLRPFRTDAIDLLIVRELVGGLYFGAKGTRPDGVVFDTCEYHPDQVERILRRGFELARGRSGHLTSVDKANVLHTSRMWRRIAGDLSREYPDVQLDHLLVDTAAMRLVQAPGEFDVIVTENTFGDILSDVAAAVAGGLGEAASASLSDRGPGLFEPVHGSAPDIAGRGIANPMAALSSTAMLLEHGLDRRDAAAQLSDAIARTAVTHRTADRGGDVTTSAFGDQVVQMLQTAELAGA